jgi:hypothetical protein
MISERPVEAADRAVPEHWEGGIVLGLGSSAIGTLIERTTRFTMLLHLPRLAGHGEAPRAKNGPTLAGRGAGVVRDAITRTIITPDELRCSLTWDQGAEMAQHNRLKVDAGIQVYVCDPQSPWQDGRCRHQFLSHSLRLSLEVARRTEALLAPSDLLREPGGKALTQLIGLFDYERIVSKQSNSTSLWRI